jgi:hypothetical protein
LAVATVGFARVFHTAETAAESEPRPTLFLLIFLQMEISDHLTKDKEERERSEIIASGHDPDR